MHQYNQAIKQFKNVKGYYLPDITLIMVPFPNITFCPKFVTHKYTSAQKHVSLIDTYKSCCCVLVEYTRNVYIVKSVLWGKNGPEASQ